MNPRLLYLLVIGIALAACAPAGQTPAPPVVTPAPGIDPTASPQPATAPPLAAATPTPAATPAPAISVTPRGDALHATDPRTVVIGAGQPVLVEFFAFW